MYYYADIYLIRMKSKLLFFNCEFDQRKLTGFLLEG